MATKKNPDVNPEDEVPNGIILLASHLNDMKVILDSICEQMIERNNLLRNAGEGKAAEQMDTGALGKLDEILAAVKSIPGHVAVLEDRVNALDNEVKGILAKPPRLLPRVEALEKKAKAEPASTQHLPTRENIEAFTATKTNGVEQASAQTGAVPGTPAKRRGRKPNPENCGHEAQYLETLENGLRRCTRCGTVLEAKVEEGGAEKAQAQDTAAATAGAKEHVETKPETVFKNIDGKMVEVDPETLEPVKVEEKKPEPAPEPKVEEKKPEPEVVITGADVRAVAIEFANKHGKDKLGEILRKYGQGNISSIPPEKCAAAFADLQAAMG